MGGRSRPPAGWVAERALLLRLGTWPGAGPDDSWPLPRPRPSAWAHRGPGGLAVPRHPHTAPLFAGPVWKSLWQGAWAGGKGARPPPPLPLPPRPVPGSRQEEAGGGHRKSPSASLPAARCLLPAAHRPPPAAHFPRPVVWRPPALHHPLPPPAPAPGPAAAEVTLKGDRARSRGQGLSRSLLNPVGHRDTLPRPPHAVPVRRTLA